MIPSIVVRIKPEGSLSPGVMNFAIMPAIKPMMIVQMMLITASWAASWSLKQNNPRGHGFRTPGGCRDSGTRAAANPVFSMHRCSPDAGEKHADALLRPRRVLDGLAYRARGD